MEIALIILLLLLPSQLGRHFWPSEAHLFGLRIDYLSPTFYLQDILILSLIFHWIWQNRFKIFSKKLALFAFYLPTSAYSLRSLWRKLLLAGYSLFAILNISASSTPLVSFFSWLRISELGLLAVIVSQNADRIYSLLTRLLPFWLVFEFFLGVGQLVKQSSLGGLFWFLGERTFNIFTPGIARGSWLGEVFLRPYGTFSHPNSLAGFTLVSLILLLGKGKLSTFEKMAAMMGGGLLLLTFSRTAWLSAFLLGAGFLLYRAKLALSRRLSFLDFPYLLIIFFLPLLTYFFSKTTIDASSFIVRGELAEFALNQIKKSPWVGVGAGSFTVSLSQNRPVWQWLYWLQPVHNIFLLIGAETGLVGLGAFITLLFFSIRRAVQFQILAALLAILFTGFFDHYWLTLIQNQLLLAIVLGLSWGGKT